ncbi:MAG: ectonucleotide pyrophosphatase/phosphodiesterase [Anaerolineales bacterium]
MNTKPIILILVDGMRPDGLLQANTSTLKRLMLTGSYSLQARTVLPSFTLPCITSLIFGVAPTRHGTLTNTFASHAWKTPGLIDLLHTAGYKTASFMNWEPLRDLSRAGALELSICLNTSELPNLLFEESDATLTSLAIAALAWHPVDFIFFYLGCVDTAGHTHGWMSPEYISAIENADLCIERLLGALPEETTVFITADHGGVGNSHGADSDEEMTTPLIMAGPGLPKGEISLPVSILDIAPTIAACAGVTPPSEWEGKPLVSIPQQPIMDKK